MIFSIEGHIKQIIDRTKTQTRRPSDKYQLGKLYAIQPKRTAKGIPEGKIYITQKFREYKPDIADIPLHAEFTRGWAIMEAGYPLRRYDAEQEGGYTVFDYEDLYETMYPKWAERWAYWFYYYTTEEILELT